MLCSTYHPITQRVTFLANRARGAAAVVTALPVDPGVSDLDFNYIVRRRLLKQNFGTHVPSTTICPFSSCISSINYDHLECCRFSRIMSNRSDAFKGVFSLICCGRLVCCLISAICCLRHVLKLRVPVILGGIRSLRRWGDPGSLMVETYICWLEVFSFLSGDEVVVDFTVFSERTVLRVDASLDTSTGDQARRLSLAEVDNRKVGLYKRMYATINVSVLGLAINLAGGVGPSLLKVIRRCSVIAGGRVPMWANWTAATFVGLGPAVGCGGAGV